MNATERTRKIEAYGEGYALLEQTLAHIPPEAWKHKPSPEDWSVHEIVVHMADSESMAALRIRKLIVEPGSTLMAYEESKWADALNYLNQNAQDCLQIIRLARRSTYGLLKSVPDRVLDHSVKHPEMGEPYTFDTWLEIYSSHIPDHVEQIKRAVQDWERHKDRPQ
jgi:hypothetical protein